MSTNGRASDRPAAMDHLRGSGLVKISIVGQDNGPAGGLTADRRLLTAALTRAGHEVTYADRRTPGQFPVDVAIFLESFADLSESHFVLSRHQVAIPNLEWFPARDLPRLARVSQIWAKSRTTHEVLSAHGLAAKTTYTGFCGDDLMDEAIPRRFAVLHVEGQSQMKGTEIVLEAWRRDRRRILPPLTVVSSFAWPGRERTPRNVTWRSGPLPAAELRELCNAHRFHLQPSRAEGFGHVLANSASCGAVLITTHRSPMSEHVDPEAAYAAAGASLIAPDRCTQIHAALPGVLAYDVNPDAVSRSVRALAERPEAELLAIGKRNRDHFARRTETFYASAGRLLDLLDLLESGYPTP